MSYKIINFIKENINIEKSNKIIENIIMDNNFNYFIKIQIINEQDYKTNNITQINRVFICDDKNKKNKLNFLNEYEFNHSNILLNTCDNYDFLINNINKKVNDINDNNKINFGYRLNFFEDGFWYFIIDIVKQNNKINNKNDKIDNFETNTNLDIESEIYDDLLEWDIKEWIIKLLEEKKEYENEKDNYIKEIINLKKQIEKLKNLKTK